MVHSRKKNFFIICAIVLLVAIHLSPQDNEREMSEEEMKNFKSSHTLYLKGVEKFEKGDREEASDVFQKCVHKMPRHAYAHYYLANLFYMGKEFSSSRSHMENALANIDYMQALCAYADDQKSLKMESLKGTLEDMWNSTNSCRDSRAIELAFDQVDKEVSDMEIAARQRKKTMERMKAHYLYFYGNVLLQLQRYNDSLLRYQEAIRLNPQHADAYNNIIAILYMAKEYSTALQFWEEAESQGLDEQLNLKLKESLYKALGWSTEGILSEDLTQREKGEVDVMRFCLDYRKEGEMSPPLYENCYIIFNSKSQEAVIIDPGVEDPRIEDFIRQHNLDVKAILNTHDHSDHTSANSYFSKLFSAPVYAPKADAEYYDSPPDRLLNDGEIIDYEGISIHVVHTSGHTEGSLCFIIGEYIFSGDTLFRNDIGKIWAENEKKKNDARKKLLLAIKERILVFPGSTVVCPGHGKTTTIAAEKVNNPYFLQ